MTKLVAILNITPDSFSDGGAFSSKDAAVAQIKALIKAGADVIDIGAHSTNFTNATMISTEEEWSRLKDILPELVKIAKAASVPISIDTINPVIAREALKLGVEYLNDQSGLTNPEMLLLLRQYPDVKAIVMHSLKLPEDRNIVLDKNIEIIPFIQSWAENKLAALNIAKDRIIIDVGIGFGKTLDQQADLIRDAKKLKDIGLKLMYGHSRKSFIGYLAGKDVNNRDIETAAITQYLAEAGVDYLRVHDIEMNKRMLNIIKTIKSDKRQKLSW